MPFRRVSTADALPVEKPWRRQQGMEWGGGMRQGEGGGGGGGDEAGDMSYFDIPTVPFELMNFHFRGQSMSVTATLVLWPKTANCRL